MAHLRVARNAALSALNVVVTGVALFLLYRFLLRTIGVGDLGVWSIVLATTSIGRLSQLGIGQSVVRLVSREMARPDQGDVLEVLHTALVAMAALAAVAILALYPAAYWLLQLVVPADMLEAARTILPWAAASLWVASVCGVLESALDGFQRLDLRALATMASMIVYLVLAVLLVPRHGLAGLAWAQLSQAAFLGLAALALVVAMVRPTRRATGFRLSVRCLREILGYGIHVQALTTGTMLLEPLVKSLLSIFAGVAMVGWFEMANRMVMQVRALVTAGGEALVPAIAHLSASDRSAVQQMYLEAYRATLFLVLPVLCLTVLVTPIVSELWIGHYEPAFVSFSYLLAAGMFLSLLAVPAYFANFGLGMLRWNTIGVAMILALTAGLAVLLARLLGANGIVGSYAGAVLVGHGVVLAGYHAREGIPMRSLLAREGASVGIAAALAAASGLGIYYALRPQLGLGTAAALMMGGAAVAVAPPFWRHPLRRRLMASLAPPA